MSGAGEAADTSAGGEVTVADLGEFGLIAAIAARLPPAGAEVIGVGDDAAVLPAPAGRPVATMDLLVEGNHFRRDWSAPADVGGKRLPRTWPTWQPWEPCRSPCW